MEGGKFIEVDALALQGIGVIGRGRMILQPSQQDQNGKSTIAIAIGEDVWKLELIGPDAMCAIGGIKYMPVFSPSSAGSFSASHGPVGRGVWMCWYPMRQPVSSPSTM